MQTLLCLFVGLCLFDCCNPAQVAGWNPLPLPLYCEVWNLDWLNAASDAGSEVSTACGEVPIASSPPTGSSSSWLEAAACTAVSEDDCALSALSDSCYMISSKNLGILAKISHLKSVRLVLL